MIKFTEINRSKNETKTTLTLCYEARIKSRLLVTLDNGTKAGLFLERGVVLKQGDILSSKQGYSVMIKAAGEKVSTAYGSTQKELLLACYHLGNRHVSLEIGDGWVRYQHDHVLDDMVKQLGLTVINETAPFAPESGAYQSGVHQHHAHKENHHDHLH